MSVRNKRNGYLYGRGVSDNEGPILVVAYAADLLRCLIEGVEEAGSGGFEGSISNLNPIGEDTPCITDYVGLFMLQSTCSIRDQICIRALLKGGSVNEHVRMHMSCIRIFHQSPV